MLCVHPFVLCTFATKKTNCCIIIQGDGRDICVCVAIVYILRSIHTTYVGNVQETENETVGVEP